MEGPIRTASVGDADAIARLVNTAYEVERFFVTGDRTSADEIRMLVREGHFLVGASPDGEIVASVFVQTAGDCGSFGMLAVDPAQQRLGWGRRLIDAAEAHARDAGCHTMEIRVVNLRDDLLPRYRRLGYLEVGQEPYDHRPTIQNCYFVIMKKPIG